MPLFKRTALVTLSWKFLMTRIRLALMLYFFIVAHQSSMRNHAVGLLEIYEDMVEVLLVLKVFLTEHSHVEDPHYGAPSCSKACLFFSDDLLRLIL